MLSLRIMQCSYCKFHYTENYFEPDNSLCEACRKLDPNITRNTKLIVKPEVNPNVKTCRVCGFTLPLDMFYTGMRVCKKCHSARVVAYDKANSKAAATRDHNLRKRKKEIREIRYEKFIANLDALAPIPPLTEKEWLAICSYFNGCAICNVKEIATRMFFVLFKDGGGYNKFNIIPVCEKCSMYGRGQPNPFIYFDKSWAGNRHKKFTGGATKQSLDAMLKHMEEQLEEAVLDAEKNKSI